MIDDEMLNYDVLVKQQNIYLYNEGLRDDDLDVLIKATQQSTVLKKLSLSHNNLTLADGKLANAIAKNTTLKELSLSHNNIGSEGVKHLADALKKNNTLQQLYLSYNNIGDEGVKYIADMLAVNKTLQIVSLEHNNIGDKGAESIAASLVLNTGLHQIYLGDNKISSTGAGKLANALKSNHNIEDLDLYKNNIGDEGAKYIADMLAENITLQKIGLGKNNIGLAGAEHLADALKKNTGLRKVDLQYNKFGNDGAKKLADALEHNNTIKELALYNNHISKDVRDRIYTILQDPNRKPNNKSKMDIANIENDTAKKDKEVANAGRERESRPRKKQSISDQKMPASNNKRDTANVDDALLYLDKVKIEFGDQSHIYNEFLEIMKDLKAQKVDTIGVINRVRRLFHGHIDLILGFNMFLPDGYKIEMKEGHIQIQEHPKVGGRRESTPPKKRQRLSESIIGGLKPQRLNFDPGSTIGGNQSSTTDGFDHAVEYVKTVKKRFAPEIYRKFLQILHEYQKTERGIKEVVDEVSLLFVDHADLLKEFVFFLPGHTQAQAKKQLEGAIKKAEEKKKVSRSVNDQLAEQKDVTKDEEIAMLRAKLEALEEVITTKDEEITSLKEFLKNSKPIEVVDLTDNTSSKRPRTEDTPKSALAIQHEQNQKIVKVKEEKVAAETSLKSVREEKLRVEDEKELALECKICFEVKEERYALVPCGHIMCSVCKESYRECPTCSRHVDSHLRIHL